MGVRWKIVIFCLLGVAAGCLPQTVVTPQPTATPSPSPTLAPPTPTPSPLLPEGPPEVALELVAEGLTAPVALVPVPDGSGRLFIVDQIGVIKILRVEGVLLEETFLDIRYLLVALNPGYDERGLLGLAFHPEYATNGRFFVYYTAPLREGGPAGWDHTNHLVEYPVSPEDPNRADPASQKVILALDHYRSNHNGGQLAFGPDGYLYLGVGDGGGGGDPLQNAQNLEVLAGKILRIDVDSGDPYGIPPDNPFMGREGRDEIFAYGLRNPYRFCFDLGYGLLVGDVGQARFEEIDVVIAGGNYGWSIKEGTACYNRSDCPGTGERGEPLIDPIIEYGRNLGQAVIGGYVYRGREIPGLFRRYIFGDWGLEQGRIFVATPPSSGEGMWAMEDLPLTPQAQQILAGQRILGFGQDEHGELYVLTSEMTGPQGNTGRVFKIVPAP